MQNWHAYSLKTEKNVKMEEDSTKFQEIVIRQRLKLAKWIGFR